MKIPLKQTDLLVNVMLRKGLLAFKFNLTLSVRDQTKHFACRI